MNTRVHNLQTADKQKDLTGTIQTRLAERGAASRRRTARPVRKKRGSKAPVLAHQSPPLAAALTDRTVEKTIRGLETIKSQGQNLIYFTTSYRQISGLKQPEFKDFPLARLIENSGRSTRKTCSGSTSTSAPTCSSPKYKSGRTKKCCRKCSSIC